MNTQDAIRMMVVDKRIPPMRFSDPLTYALFLEYGQNGFAALNMSLERWLTLIGGDIELLAHTPVLRASHDSIFQLSTRRPYQEACHFIKEHFKTLPDYSYETCRIWVMAVQSYASDYVLATMFNCIAHHWTPDVMTAFSLDLLGTECISIPPYIPPESVSHTLLWKDLWDELSFEKMDWNSIFLQYMQKYWDFLPYGLFLTKLQPEQEQHIPEHYHQAMRAFEKDPQAFLLVHHTWADSPYHIPLGAFVNYYNKDTPSYEECQVWLP